MGLILLLVFLGVFALIALPLVAANHGQAKVAKQVIATLDSALSNESVEVKAQLMNLRKESNFSSIPWLNSRLHKVELVPHVQRLLDQAGMNWSAGKLLAACAAGFFVPVYVLYSRFGFSLIELPVGLVVGALPLLLVLFKRKKRFYRFQELLPEALDLMVSGLRAGHSLIAAIGLVSRECPEPVGNEFRTCFDEQNYGLDMKAAIENMIVRIPIQDLRIMATAIMIQKESGGNLAEVLNNTSHCIRESFRLRRDIRVHTAQGRLTGVILTLLPVVLGVVSYMLNPDNMSVLWKRDIGIKLIWTAAIMIVMGGLVIRKIVNIRV